jgi:hypothetical protein
MNHAASIGSSMSEVSPRRYAMANGKQYARARINQWNYITWIATWERRKISLYRIRE